MSETLKPCPFCGASAVIIRPYLDEWNAEDGFDRAYRAACVAKSCGTKGRMWQTEDAATTAWNRRLP